VLVAKGCHVALEGEGFALDGLLQVGEHSLVLGFHDGLALCGMAQSLD